MIFIAKNEEGKSTCDLVLKKQKTVTRRPDGKMIYKVGKDYAVQPGRGKNQVGRIKMISIQDHYKWWEENIKFLSDDEMEIALQKEAHKEGFNSWQSLIDYFLKNNIMPLSLIRYEFELIN